jgi:hypothetical protein
MFVIVNNQSSFMKKTLLFIIYLAPLFVFSQSNKEIIQNYLKTPNAKTSISNRDFNDWVIQSEGSSSSTNIENCFVIQRYQGIEIFRAISNFSIKQGKVVDVQKRYVNDISNKVNATVPSLSVTDALAKAYFQLGIIATSSFTVLENSQLNKFKIDNGLGIDDPVTANLVYHQAKDGKLKLAWNFTIHTLQHDTIWSVRIDALNGKILEKKNIVISCDFDRKKSHLSVNNYFANTANSSYKQIFSSAPMQVQSGSYRVIPFNYESPNHSSFQLVSDPANSKASPYGWHDVNAVSGAEYTITRGNNVWAKDDFFAENLSTGLSPDGGVSLVFDFPYGGTDVNAFSYVNAANTNLFYMNNIMHDIWYQYGFDETNGNFQQNNYGRGGTGSDYVLADAQDGSQADPMSINNANFSTGDDGVKPRMQMFLWNNTPEVKPIIIDYPANLAGSYAAKQNSFNPGKVDLPVEPAFLQSDLVLYLDSVGGTSEGCSAPSNVSAMNGKIVILKRGNCTFAVKTKAAQDAGAIALIVVNNAEGEITMSGADETIKIPAISISKSIGESILTQMKTEAVHVKLQIQASQFVNTDGDFDNGIIAHEYGHGISTRLAGGRNNSSCLDNTDQMGEGWSDWFALMLQIKPGDFGAAKRGIGTFVSMQPTDGLGIRDYAYSTDKTINPMTYAFTNKYQYIDNDDIEQTSVHGVGSVWTTMLWDLTWAYINKYGYDNNKYTGTGGNNKLMRIVLDGIKLQPCSPTFVDGRDAILAADQAITGGKDYCMIWEVFASRGLGVNASAGDGNIGNDQVEDFTRPASGANCSLATSDVDSDNVMRVFPNPSKGDIKVRINNYNGTVNIKVVDINGRQVYTAINEVFNNEKTFDLSKLTSGIYILEIEGEALKYIEKIIIN